MPGPETVLVVDDEPSIRLLCRVNLELEGYRVVEAGSLAEARRALAAEPVSVVLLDVNLSGEDGRDLLDDLGDRPAALLTGDSSLDGATQARVGAVLPKPFELDDLVETVRRLAAP